MVLLAQASLERVPTGNGKLDDLCGGGFFRDSVVLVSGATGTGKTLIACEFVRAAVAAGERALFVSLEESRSQFVRNARSWGISFGEAEQAGDLRLEFRRPERMLLEDLLLDLRRLIDEFDPSRLLELLSRDDEFRLLIAQQLAYRSQVSSGARSRGRRQ